MRNGNGQNGSMPKTAMTVVWVLFGIIVLSTLTTAIVVWAKRK
jgi:hypothetical protein